MLTIKYKPQKIEELIGQNIAELVKAIKNNEKVILYGPPGTGKTSSVYAIANELNYEVIEINASDDRSKSDLEKYLPAVKQMSIFGKKKVILIDEIDGISNTDTGAINGIMNLTKASIFPVVITANDIWDKKFKELRNICKMFEFRHIPKDEIYKHLKKIANKEQANIDDETLMQISISCKGDLRAALNDLNAIIYSKDKDLSALGRELEQKIVNSILTIIYKNTYAELSQSLTNVELDPEEIIYWIEHNIFNANFSKESIAEILNNINNANHLLSEIKKNDYWRLLVYFYFYLSVMVGKSKKESPKNFKFSQPDLFLHKWIGNNKNAIKNEIILKLAKLTHTNQNIIAQIFERYVIILKNEKELQELLELDKNQIEYLNKRD
ncbi:MAG: AAA family ATPase [Candidatus Woesearchaeota archaeon]